MPDQSVNIEQFEQHIINSIESLLLEDEQINAKCKLPNEDVKKPQTPIKPRPKLHLNMKDARHRSLQHPKSPIIDRFSYGGTQNYVKWSAIESDELKDPLQQPYVNPATYFSPPLTPVSPMGMRPEPLTPINSPPIPLLSPVEDAQLLINQYLLYNYRLYNGLKYGNIPPLLNAATVYNQMVTMPRPGLNYKTMPNLAYNQWVQQRMINQEQEYLKILNYYANVKQQKSVPTPPKTFCSFCKENGQPYASYTSHTMKAGNMITCPILREYTCSNCGQHGHTVTHCTNIKRCEGSIIQMLDLFKQTQAEI